MEPVSFILRRECPHCCNNFVSIQLLAMEKKDLNVPRLYYRSFSQMNDDCNDGGVVNPFNHELNFSNLDYVVSFVLGLILVPIRIILVGIIILFGWIGAAIFTSDWLKNPEGIQNSKLRLKCYELLLKLLGLACGFIVTVEGKPRCQRLTC